MHRRKFIATFSSAMGITQLASAGRTAPLSTVTRRLRRDFVYLSRLQF